jgi:hypothetical protein
MKTLPSVTDVTFDARAANSAPTHRCSAQRKLENALYLVNLSVNCFTCALVALTVAVGQVVGAATQQHGKLEQLLHYVDDAIVVGRGRIRPASSNSL